MVSREGKSPEPGDLTELLGKVRSAGVNRRRFLKGAGIGSLALASLPTVGSALARKAFAGDLLAFHLVTVSTNGGVPIGPGVHLLIVAGAGHIHDSSISGGGRFQHVLAPDPVAPPFELVEHGTWRMKSVVDWSSIGSANGFQAGILDVIVEVTDIGTGDVFDVPSRVTCNIGPAGLLTGLREGVFVPGTPVGDFEPLEPAVGLTAFIEM